MSLSFNRFSWQAYPSASLLPGERSHIAISENHQETVCAVRAELNYCHGGDPHATERTLSAILKCAATKRASAERSFHIIARKRGGTNHVGKGGRAYSGLPSLSCPLRHMCVTEDASAVVHDGNMYGPGTSNERVPCWSKYRRLLQGKRSTTPLRSDAHCQIFRRKLAYVLPFPCQNIGRRVTI